MAEASLRSCALLETPSPLCFPLSVSASNSLPPPPSSSSLSLSLSFSLSPSLRRGFHGTRVGETMGKGMRDFLSDPEKMTAAAATVTAIALGIYSARVGTSVAGRYIESRLGKPSLIRETSRRSVLQVSQRLRTHARSLPQLSLSLSLITHF